MNLLLWVDLASLATALSLAALCLTHGRREQARFRPFVVLLFSAALYHVAHISYEVVADAAAKVRWVRVGFAGAFLLMPAIIMIPASVLRRPPPPKLLRNFVQGATVLFLILDFTEGMFTSTPRGRVIGAAGPLFLLTLPVYVLACGYFFATLIRALLATDCQQTRNRVGWLLLGSLAFLLTSVPDILRRLGVVDLFGGPVAAVGLMTFNLCATYAMLRHHLLDIDLVVTRGIVYAILIPGLTLVYFLTGETLEQITQQMTHANSVVGGVSCAIVIAILFEPARRFLQIRVDRFFLKDHELLRRLQSLERVSGLVVAEDVNGLEDVVQDLNWVVSHVKNRSGSSNP